MHDHFWNGELQHARLQSGALFAVVDVNRPAEGLREISFAGAEWPSARILGVRAATPPSRAGKLLECYTRGADLVAAYQEDSSDPTVRMDAVWRAVPPGPADEFLAAVDLVVSVRTDALEGRPRRIAESRVPDSEVLGLDRDGAGRFTWIDGMPKAAPSQVLSRGCFLFRPGPTAWSYVEMVHPADFVGSEVGNDPDAGAGFLLQHQLFPQSLEKGVILRARVRALLVPREGDQRIAADLYQAFADAEPPLGS